MALRGSFLPVRGRRLVADPTHPDGGRPPWTSSPLVGIGVLAGLGGAVGLFLTGFGGAALVAAGMAGGVPLWTATRSWRPLRARVDGADLVVFGERVPLDAVTEVRSAIVYGDDDGTTWPGVVLEAGERFVFQTDTFDEAAIVAAACRELAGLPSGPPTILGVARPWALGFEPLEVDDGPCPTGLEMEGEDERLVVRLTGSHLRMLEHSMAVLDIVRVESTSLGHPDRPAVELATKAGECWLLAVERRTVADVLSERLRSEVERVRQDFEASHTERRGLRALDRAVEGPVDNLR